MVVVRQRPFNSFTFLLVAGVQKTTHGNNLQMDGTFRAVISRPRSRLANMEDTEKITCMVV